MNYLLYELLQHLVNGNCFGFVLQVHVPYFFAAEGFFCFVVSLFGDNDLPAFGGRLQALCQVNGIANYSVIQAL
jgi:hypothetical protein